MVYGTPIKALIHEKFGDGIMSMIDCRVKVERKPDPKGDRVLLTFECVFHARYLLVHISRPDDVLSVIHSGKFLPYLRW